MDLDVHEYPSANETSCMSAILGVSTVGDLDNNIDYRQLSVSNASHDEALSDDDLSITCTDAERAALKADRNQFDDDSRKPLTTITDEQESVISIVDATGDYEETKTSNGNFVDQTADITELTEYEATNTERFLDERDYFQSSIVELGRCLWKSTLDEQHYTKGCLWSPDGTCVLVPVHLDGMHIIELPRDLYKIEELKKDRELSNLTTAVHVKEGGTVYDCAWYPFMNSDVPESCCWLATRQHEPIHLWDAFSGELRCSYRGYDQVDEVESAISVKFSNEGDKVIGGYKKTIKIFDTNIPGRDYSSVPVKKAVSCFAFTLYSSDTVTAGSWKGYIDHYDLRALNSGSLFTLGYHTGGITWLRYTKSEPVMLFSGARRDNKLLQWDMRNYKEPLREFQRSVTTNQRIYFDLSPEEEWLASGDCEGLLHIWDRKHPKEESIDIPLHGDCCNGVNFHPTLPIIATSSGQYHFLDVASEPAETTLIAEQKIVKYENALLFLLLNASELDT